MNPETEKIAAEAFGGATKGGLFASAAAITSGLAVASTPVKLLGLIAIGTTTAVSWPLVAGIGVVGALCGGLSAALVEGHRQQRISEEFTRLMNKP